MESTKPVVTPADVIATRCPAGTGDYVLQVGTVANRWIYHNGRDGQATTTPDPFAARSFATRSDAEAARDQITQIN